MLLQLYNFVHLYTFLLPCITSCLLMILSGAKASSPNTLISSFPFSSIFFKECLFILHSRCMSTHTWQCTLPLECGTVVHYILVLSLQLLSHPEKDYILSTVKNNKSQLKACSKHRKSQLSQLQLITLLSYQSAKCQQQNNNFTHKPSRYLISYHTTSTILSLESDLSMDLEKKIRQKYPLMKSVFFADSS